MPQKNNGKALENLVSQIEKLFHNNDVNIETNVKATSDEGIVLNEFDLIVTGKFGSTIMRWLIECRDRPSSGKQGISWIEQLYGRKSMNDFHKVTAVSTTGFSPSSITAAEKHGIELRTVKNLSLDQIEWIPSITYNVVFHETKVKRVLLGLAKPYSLNESVHINSSLLKQDFKSVGLHNDGKHETFHQFFLSGIQAQADYDNLFESIEPNGDPLAMKIRGQVNTDQVLEANVDGRIYKVELFVIWGELSKINIHPAFSSAFIYANEREEENTIAKGVNNRIILPDGAIIPLQHIATETRESLSLSPPEPNAGT